VKVFVSLAAAVCLIVLSAVPAAVGAGLLASHKQDVVLSASWAQGYSSLGDLRKAAALVAVGHVAGIVYEGEDVLSPGVATTRYSFVVDRLIKGQAAGTIVVKQTGGHLGDVLQRIEDDPLMAAGDRYVLFLSRVSGGPYDGDYIVLGGPDGRVAVDANGELRSLGQVDLGATKNVSDLR
jgi:hypothetical protein